MKLSPKADLTKREMYRFMLADTFTLPTVSSSGSSVSLAKAAVGGGVELPTGHSSMNDADFEWTFAACDSTFDGTVDPNPGRNVTRTADPNPNRRYDQLGGVQGAVEGL